MSRIAYKTPSDEDVQYSTHDYTVKMQLFHKKTLHNTAYQNQNDNISPIKDNN